MTTFIRTHLNDILLAFFVMASAARGIGQIYPLAVQTATQTTVWSGPCQRGLAAAATLCLK